LQWKTVTCSSVTLTVDAALGRPSKTKYLPTAQTPPPTRKMISAQGIFLRSELN
jgi:hypothetical protein